MMEIAFPPNTKRSGNVIIARKEEVELQKQNSEWQEQYGLFGLLNFFLKMKIKQETGSTDLSLITKQFTSFRLQNNYFKLQKADTLTR